MLRHRRCPVVSGRRNVCASRDTAVGSPGFAGNRIRRDRVCNRWGTAGVSKVLVHGLVSVALVLVGVVLLAATFGELGSFEATGAVEFSGAQTTRDLLPAYFADYWGSEDEFAPLRERVCVAYISVSTPTWFQTSSTTEPRSAHSARPLW
jgi:hypothetical protein